MSLPTRVEPTDRHQAVRPIFAAWAFLNPEFLTCLDVVAHYGKYDAGSGSFPRPSAPLTRGTLMNPILLAADREVKSVSGVWLRAEPALV